MKSREEYYREISIKQESLGICIMVDRPNGTWHSFYIHDEEELHALQERIVEYFILNRKDNLFLQ